MIIITGAAGFIGSCLVNKLNNKGIKELVLVDDFSREDKNRNLNHKIYLEKVDRKEFFDWSKGKGGLVREFIHLGARTDTTEVDQKIFDELNLEYSKKVWQFCALHQIPLIYASSAATYGDGANGFSDDHSLIALLKPLNLYGESKNNFDKWALEQKSAPPIWTGLKFFNVYGPNEYHKARMASVIFHAFGQISDSGKMVLFRSHKPEYANGGQKRDFIYVKDITEVIFWLLKQRIQSGIYNLGTGNARSFNDLAKAIFSALKKPEAIEFVDTPEDIRDKYQYFTESPMQKLRNAGYDKPFYSLENGVEDYVQAYLINGAIY